MRLQNWSGLGLAIAIAAMVCQAARAEVGRPSRQALEQMGLGSMVVISDEEALAVRGHGFYGGGSLVHVTGNSFATIDKSPSGSHSENAYDADGKHFAKGENFSFAGVVHISSSHKGDKKRGDHHGNNNMGGQWGGNHGGQWGGDMGGPWGGDSGGQRAGGGRHGGGGAGSLRRRSRP